MARESAEWTRVGRLRLGRDARVRPDLHASFNRAQSAEPAAAWEIVAGWLARCVAKVLVPDGEHLDRMKSIAAQLGTGGNLPTDAHVASMAIGRRARVCGFDTDFDRIDGIGAIAP